MALYILAHLGARIDENQKRRGRDNTKTKEGSVRVTSLRPSKSPERRRELNESDVRRKGGWEFRVLCARASSTRILD